ncbi:type II toxin-antitoxin system prevent-host-death family antitoxin [Streptomyces sp. WAC05858]|uniref:type II toxin-antitoxin system prevent-host-death family antitoxin n=2 Tax=Streptomyces TaxID=1883 RepID=UPI001C8EF635|nr:type II toxin-antitoxin system prevent-host-death family antitoxin [Streptomyces sp. WAC05858]
MYIIAVGALMYITSVGYTAVMTAPKKEHEERIADARNALADVINKARYLQEPTFLTNRGKRVAVVVSTDFYDQSRQRAAAIAELREVFRERPDIAEALEGHADDLYEHLTSGAI